MNAFSAAAAPLAVVRHRTPPGTTLAALPPPSAVRALYGLLRQGHRVYVHCTVGLNRAPLVVLTYLTLIEGLSLDAARDLLQCARPGVFPSEEAYAGCCMDLAAQYGDRIRQRARELRQGSALPEQEAWRQAERAIWRQALTAE